MAKKKRDLTIEYGRGETYRNDRVTVYEHGTYPRSSVLAGMPSRTWLDEFDSVEAALAAYPDAVSLIDGDGSSSTHIPVDRMVAHLPGEEGEP